VTIRQADLRDETGQIVDTLDVGAPVKLSVQAIAHETVDRLVLGYAIKDRFGQTAYGTNTFYSGQVLEEVKAGEVFDFTIRFPADLGVGTYSVALALVGGEDHLGENYEWRDLSILFSVANLSRQAFDGAVYLPSQIEVARFNPKP